MTTMNELFENQPYEGEKTGSAVMTDDGEQDVYEYGGDAGDIEEKTGAEQEDRPPPL